MATRFVPTMQSQLSLIIEIWFFKKTCFYFLESVKNKTMESNINKYLNKQVGVHKNGNMHFGVFCASFSKNTRFPCLCGWSLLILKNTPLQLKTGEDPVFLSHFLCSLKSKPPTFDQDLPLLCFTHFNSNNIKNKNVNLLQHDTTCINAAVQDFSISNLA